MSAKPRRRLRNTLVVVLVLAVIYIAYRLTLHSMVEARINDIRNRHEPATLIELGKSLPHPTAEKNSAELYLQAFAKYSKFKFSEGDPRAKSLPVVGLAKLPGRGENLSGEMRAMIAQYLSENMEALQLLHAGANRSQCRYPVDYSKGIVTLPTHFSAVRQGARLLLLESVSRADAGDLAGAVEALKAEAALAKSVGSDPTLFAHLVRIACQRVAGDGLELILSRGQLTEAQLTDLEAVWSGLAEENAIVPVMIGERCFGVTAFETLRKLALKDREQIGWFAGDGKGGSIGVFCLYRFGGLADLDLMDYLPILNGYIQVCRLPLEQRPAAVRPVCAGLAPPSRWHVLSRGLANALDNAIIIDVRRLTQLHAAIMALRVERYRLNHGELPIELAAVGGPVSTDPFSNRPLRYKKLAKGYVVYSVGEDGTDDGGDEKQDITFVVER